MGTQFYCRPRSTREPTGNRDHHAEDEKTLEANDQVVQQGVPENPRSPAKDRTGELVNEESLTQTQPPSGKSTCYNKCETNCKHHSGAPASQSDREAEQDCDQQREPLQNR